MLFSPVPHRPDKVMKRLLPFVCCSHKPNGMGELKKYYERKVAEGKNKMSVINALRAKNRGKNVCGHQKKREI